MSEEAGARQPQETIMQALFGFMASRALTVAAMLNVADALTEGPCHCSDLAATVGADQRSLHRLLRLLVSLGIFEETAPGTYGLNGAADLLRSDHPQSMRDMAAMITSPSHWAPWGEFEAAVRSGESGARHAFGTDIFTWFQQEENREQWELFNAAMTSFSAGIGAAVAEAFDFGSFAKIVDIGGGHGLLLRQLLAAAPQATGVLFDLPGVVEGADQGELADRLEIVGGDFFENVPVGGDAYVLKHIIHDWNDEKCVTILRNVAAAMTTDGRVLVAEIVMPDTSEPHPAKFMDVNMLAMTEGGRERTEAEYATLFESAGLRLVAIHPTDSIASIVEGVRA